MQRSGLNWGTVMCIHTCLGNSSCISRDIVSLKYLLRRECFLFLAVTTPIARI